MGDISDMVLEGLLDEETGEYIGDLNEGEYGMEAPGFPISYERREICEICQKKFKTYMALSQHLRDKHGVSKRK